MKSSAPIVPRMTSVEEFKYYAVEMALQAEVPPQEVLKTIECESNWDHLAQGDNNSSIGLSQINLPSHPHVSREAAEDPKYAIDFMVNEFEVGNKEIWTCARNLGYK